MGLRMKMQIEFDMPPGATIPEARAYVKEALGGWGGGYHPEHPFFGSIKTVEIGNTSTFRVEKKDA